MERNNVPDYETNKQQVKMKIVFALEFARVDFQLSAANVAYVQCQQFSGGRVDNFKQLKMREKRGHRLHTVK